MNIPVIKNLDVLATSPLRRDVLNILESGYASVLTDRVIREEVLRNGDELSVRGHTINLSDYERIFFVGIGKCAVDAAHVFEDLLGDRIVEGIVIDVKSSAFKKMHSYVGAHPFPGEENVRYTREILTMLRNVTARDLVITVISGGGSSLLCAPYQIDTEKLATITRALWKGGASISEVNTVRKHLSEVKGGQLAKRIYPGTMISFIFSDVPGNDISMIASGPTVRDTTTIEDAEAILVRYDVLALAGIPECTLVETPKEQKYFDRVLNVLIVTNSRALEAMKQKAESLGYRAEVKYDALEGNAATIGAEFARAPMPPKTCYLFGGETTVAIKGDGVGGRNQEFALSASLVIPDHRVVLAASSDGWDNTDVAGALTDAGDRKRAQEAGIDPRSFLSNNDSYHFWKAIGGAIETGRTGINVADFYIVISE